jgi:hypothetical protein
MLNLGVTLTLPGRTVPEASCGRETLQKDGRQPARAKQRGGSEARGLPQAQLWQQTEASASDEQRAATAGTFFDDRRRSAGCFTGLFRSAPTLREQDASGEAASWLFNSRRQALDLIEPCTALLRVA